MENIDPLPIVYYCEHTMIVRSLVLLLRGNLTESLKFHQDYKVHSSTISFFFLQPSLGDRFCPGVTFRSSEYFGTSDHTAAFTKMAIPVAGQRTPPALYGYRKKVHYPSLFAKDAATDWTALLHDDVGK